MIFLNRISLDGLRHAFDQLTPHKLRTSLTLLGTVFGLSTLIAILSIGDGAEQESLRPIESMGVHNPLLRPIESMGVRDFTLNPEVVGVRKFQRLSVS
jgi:putative ABC transport system permease protein